MVKLTKEYKDCVKVFLRKYPGESLEQLRLY